MTRISDQHEIAKTICTPKEYEAWELTTRQGLSNTAAAYHLGISPSSARDRIRSAQRKIDNYSRSEFPPATEPQTEPRKHLSDNHRRAAIALLIQRDGPACYLCQRTPPLADYCVEHIIPRAHGGTDDAHNLALACSDCNNAKGSKYVSLRVSSRRPVYHHVGM